MRVYIVVTTVTCTDHDIFNDVVSIHSSEEGAGNRVADVKRAKKKGDVDLYTKYGINSGFDDINFFHRDIEE